MARRKDTGHPVGEVDEAALVRRAHRMVRALVVASDPPTDPLREVRDELSAVLRLGGFRPARAPIADRVRAGEELLERHGLLDRVERHLQSLENGRFIRHTTNEENQ